MPNAILALNAGSSSIKFALFELGSGTEPAALLHGQIEGIGTAPHLTARDTAGATLVERRWPDGAAQSHEALLDQMLGWIEAHLGDDKLVGVGHRVVHGGRAFTAPVLIDEAVLTELEALTPLAPLHQPHSIAPIRAIMASRPGLRQFACFDTAFHHTMPAVASRIALPLAYAQEGVRRYGFHGLSYEYIATRLAKDLPHLALGRVIVAHLGSGASLCAMRNGRSVDTTMGFTALDGLVMGTRCGAIDPGVLLYLLQQKAMSPHALEHLLYSESGLLGVSGVSSDMRKLLASSDPRAKDAVELFVFRIARETAALAASLGGLDGFVFTAGIGEHATEIQEAVCDRLRWLGVTPGRRDAGGTRISAPGSAVEVHVIPTDEEAMISRHTLQTLAAADGTAS
jgi:acetate kinase